MSANHGFRYLLSHLSCESRQPVYCFARLPDATITDTAFAQEKIKSAESLSLMPAELLTIVFCQLSSFIDVFTLATTCSGLRHIWIAGSTPIYNQAAPRSVEWVRHTQAFLADTTGPAADSPYMFTRAIACMIRSSCRNMVTEAMIKFEREISYRESKVGYTLHQEQLSAPKHWTPSLGRWLLWENSSGDGQGSD